MMYLLPGQRSKYHADETRGARDWRDYEIRTSDGRVLRRRPNDGGDSRGYSVGAPPATQLPANKEEIAEWLLGDAKPTSARSTNGVDFTWKCGQPPPGQAIIVGAQSGDVVGSTIARATPPMYAAPIGRGWGAAPSSVAYSHHAGILGWIVRLGILAFVRFPLRATHGMRLALVGD